MGILGIIEITALIALIAAVIGWVKVGKLTKRVNQTETEMESLRSHVTASNNILKREIADVLNNLERRVKTAAAESGEESEGFHADMTVAEVLDLHPGAAGVMAKFHLGGCSSCAISEHHILGPACESYGVDTNKLLNELNALLGGAPATPEPNAANA